MCTKKTNTMSSFEGMRHIGRRDAIRGGQVTDRQEGSQDTSSRQNEHGLRQNFSNFM